MGCGSLEIRLAAGGRANLVATEDCCVLVDDELLKQINCTASVVNCHAAQFRIRQNRAAPRDGEERSLRRGPGATRGPVDDPPGARADSSGSARAQPDGRGALHGPAERRSRAPALREHHAAAVGALCATANFVLSTIEEDGAVVRGLEHLLRAKPTTILVASTTAPAVPEMSSAGPSLTSARTWSAFLAPVEPGNLLLLAYKDEVPIVSAPAASVPQAQCRGPDSAAMLAQYRVSGWEVACLGHGGLLA